MLCPHFKAFLDLEKYNLVRCLGSPKGEREGEREREKEREVRGGEREGGRQRGREKGREGERKGGRGRRTERGRGRGHYLREPGRGLLGSLCVFLLTHLVPTLSFPTDDNTHLLSE